MNYLKEALEHYAVSERADTTAWDRLANWGNLCASSGVAHVDVMEKEIAVAEENVKKDFGLTALPNAWRSAKSTVLSAVTLNVPLMDNGQVRSKQAVTKDVAKARGTNPNPDPAAAASLPMPALPITCPSCGHTFQA